MKAEKLLEKLESYEQKAYDGGYGSDWLAMIGENLKFYVEHCIQNDESVTMTGFILWVDKIAAD